MLAQIPSATLLGVEGHAVQVEVNVAIGLPSFNVVGLPDASCREARDRVRAAITNAGYKWPDKRITVNLAPTHVRKVGSGLDLAIAVGILAAAEHIKVESVRGLGFLGELGLDGSVRPVVGALPLVDVLGDVVPVVPADSYAEACLVRSDSRPVASLPELIAALGGRSPWPAPCSPASRCAPLGMEPDMGEVEGQAVARRALEVAAAGGHHMLMIGPPGAGKTMLAERLPSLLPDLDDRSALDVSRIHSAAGRLESGSLIRRPPFRSPHHSASLVALIGGGSTTLRPGEVSLASGGVLFLDELGEFPPAHLDALRQPLESGTIHIARAANSATLPARFLLVAATNPCPCGIGLTGDCRCSGPALARYARRLSGPLLDRLDIRLAVQRPDHRAVLGDRSKGAAGVPTSAEIRERIVTARGLARERGVSCNRELRGSAVDRFAPLTSAGRERLRASLAGGMLTMRGAQRLRLVALTIKDLEAEDGPISDIDLDEAMMLRGQENSLGMAL